MNYFIYKDKNEWLLHRQLGGSDAYLVAGGKNNYTNVLEIATRLRTHETPQEDDTEQTKHGQELEPLLREYYQITHKSLILERYSPYGIFISNIDNRLTASLDGLFKDTSNNYSAIEIKTRKVYKKDELNGWTLEDIPLQYIFQLLHYFLVVPELNFIDLIVCFEPRFAPDPCLVSFTKLYHFERLNYLSQIKALEKIELEFLKKVDSNFMFTIPLKGDLSHYLNLLKEETR